MPINSFYYKLDTADEKKSRQKLLTDRRNEFLQVFSDGFGCCTKTELEFEMKGKVKLVFKPEVNLLFSSLAVMNKEIEWLEKVGVIEKVDYPDWVSSTVYVKNENKKDKSLCRFFNGPK